MGRTLEISKEIEEKVIKNYLDNKLSLVNSGKEFGLTQKVVERILRDYGVKKRTYSEAKQLSRKYSCDDNYFKQQNHNMAYILGLLASDGSISKKENLISIVLKSEDSELLKKIAIETKVSRPLDNFFGNNTQNYYTSFRNWSKTWKDDLQHYGIVPQKTFTLTPPDLLLPEYRIDYIRGYFDGDGSIYSVESQNRVFFEVTGASKPLIDWIRNELLNNYHILLNKESKEIKDNGTIMYKIKIGSKEELIKLYNLFYSNDSLYLERKKKQFELLLNIPRDSNSSIEE